MRRSKASTSALSSTWRSALPTGLAGPSADFSVLRSSSIPSGMGWRANSQITVRSFGALTRVDDVDRRAVREFVARELGHLPQATRRKLVCDNAAKLYRLG